MIQDHYGKLLVGVGVVAGLAIVYGFSRLVGWLLTVVLVFGVVSGFALVPGSIRLLGPSLPMKSVFGLGTMILAQLANGATCAYVREDDTVDLCPYDPDTNRARIDGTWTALGEDVLEYRIAWRPWVISWEKSDRSLRSYCVAEQDTYAEGEDGTALVKEQRDERPLWTPDADPRDGYIVHCLRYLQDMGRSGNRLLNRTEEITMRDYAGDSSMGGLWVYILLGGSFFGTFITTYLLLVLF